MNITVFCGSGFGINPAYVEETIRLGKHIAQKGHQLIYGGGNTGLMGTLADTVLQEGGKVTGVIPRPLVDRERAHQHLTSLHIVNTMHERKAMMERLSDGFIALPGGLGTFDEIIEILTWKQLRFINKPAGFINFHGYFDHLIGQIDFAVKEGFIFPDFRENILVEPDSEKLLERLAAY